MSLNFVALKELFFKYKFEMGGGKQIMSLNFFGEQTFFFFLDLWYYM